MKNLISLSCFVFFALFAVRAAHAGWTHEVAQARANATSLKVTEPEGFRVSVLVGGDTRTDTVPAVFTLPDEDGFYEVTLTAADGSTWTKKIEVKAYFQTGLKARYAPDAAPGQGPAAPIKRHIGRIKNTSDKCAPANRVELRFDFIKDGNLHESRAVAPGRQDNNVEVAAGNYDVRIFARMKAEQEFQFWRTQTLEVGQDGWKVVIGCGE